MKAFERLWETIIHSRVPAPPFKPSPPPHTHTHICTHTHTQLYIPSGWSLLVRAAVPSSPLSTLRLDCRLYTMSCGQKPGPVLSTCTHCPAASTHHMYTLSCGQFSSCTQSHVDRNQGQCSVHVHTVLWPVLITCTHCPVASTDHVQNVLWTWTRTSAQYMHITILAESEIHTSKK